MQAPTFVLVQYHPPGVAHINGAFWYLYKGEQVQELHERGLDVQPYQEWPADQVRFHLLQYALTC